MKILFIGGTGVISSAITKKLSERSDIELFLLNRKSGEDFVSNNVKFLQGDIRNKDEVRELISELTFDVVVDFICYTKENAEIDFELFNGKTKQFIFISSASCYQKPPVHYISTESTPLRNPFWQYSKDKIECEDFFMEKYRADEFPVTIVRPSHTYGKDKVVVPVSGAKTGWTYIDMILNDMPIVVPGDGTSLWTITHTSDFAKGFVGLIGNNKAVGHSFHITSDEVLTWNEIVNELGEAIGKKPKIVHMATDYICKKEPYYIGPLLGDKSNSAIFDNSKVKSFVPNFVCEKSFKDGIKEVVEYIKSNRELQIVDNEYIKKINNLLGGYNI